MPELLVKDFLGKKGKKGDIGIEIEVESPAPLPLPPAKWTVKPEGSLRLGGLEYISDGPLTITDVPKAIDDLNATLKGCDKINHDSIYSSVHMHCNVLYQTPIQYWTQVCAYWLTEPLLFDFLGAYRNGSCFCLSLDKAEGVMDFCLKDLKGDIPFRTIGNNNIRYASQNLKATKDFGSIEYRSMAFTLEPKKLNTWAQELYRLRLATKDFRSPADLMDTYFREEDKPVFLSKLFSKPFVKKIAFDTRNRLETNEGILCELAYLHDWDKWAKKIENSFFAKKRDLKDADAEFPRAVRNIAFDDMIDNPIPAPIRWLPEEEDDR